MLLPGERQIWIFVCVKARLSFHFCYDILVVTFLFQTEETLRNEETGMMIAAKDVIFLVPMLLCALLVCDERWLKGFQANRLLAVFTNKPIGVLVGAAPYGA